MAEIIQDLQKDIARRLIQAASLYDWHSISFTFTQLVTISESTARVETKDGGIVHIGDATGVGQLLSALRKAMATDSHGTWYSVTATAVKNGQLDLDFNYQDRPSWDLPPPTEAYIEDHESYPRPNAELPDWHPSKVDAKTK